MPLQYFRRLLVAGLLLTAVPGWAVCGDVNGDSSLSILDVVLGLRVASGLQPATPSNLEGGDLNGNGRVEITEVLRVLRVVAGLEDPATLGCVTPPPPPPNQPGVSTLVGDPMGHQDGPGATARFQLPQDVAIDGNGNLYVADRYNHRIRKILPDGTVTTLAGTGFPGYRDGPGDQAQFENPIGVAVDAQGNVYVADTYSHHIRMISQADGTVTTIAGTATRLGDTDIWQGGFLDGPALTAQFAYPWHLDVDSRGGLYVADTGNNRIRYITPPDANGQRTVRTVAGSEYGFEDNVPGSQALFRGPSDVHVAPNGRVWVSDTYNHLIRFVEPDTDETVGTLAGHPRLDLDTGEPLGGFADGPEPDVQFFFPVGLSLGPDGAVYVADVSNWRIRRVDSSGGATTVAGGDFGGFRDGPGAQAAFFFPESLAVAPDGTIYVADSENNLIRKIAPDEERTTSIHAGVPVNGSKDGPGNEARIQWPFQVSTDAAGNAYIADTGNALIRKVAPDGTVTTLAGSTEGFRDGPASQAQFRFPMGVAADPQGNVYVADSDNQRIRKIDTQGNVTTLAGGGDPGEGGYVPRGFADGQGSEARFADPAYLRWGPDGNLYVADSANHRIRRVTPEGVVTTIAGSGTFGGFADGPVNQARFFFPQALDFGPDGAIYVADGNNMRVRKIKDGQVTTIAGAPEEDEFGDPLGGFRDGPGNLALFDVPTDVAVDGNGNVYVTDYFNNRIRRISGTDGTVTTVTGNGRNGHRDGALSLAIFRRPISLDFTPQGHLLVSERWNNRIRRIILPGDGSPVLR